MNVSSLNTRTAATAAIACLAAFPVAVLGLTIVQAGHYSPVRQAMSELALGRDGAVMNIAFCALGVGSILFAVALRATLRSITAPAILAVTGLLDFVSAVFHTSHDGATIQTTANKIHDTAGLVTFLLLMAAMFVAARTMRRSDQWQSFALPTRMWAMAAVAGFFLVPILGDAHFGIAQRVFVGTVLAWMITTAARARRLEPAHITTLALA